METHDLPQHPQHIFYQPVIPDGQQRVSRAASPPSIPHAGQGSRRSTTPGAGYQVVKDELRRILIGVVTQLVNPKWWLYGLFEELGASKAFLKQFKGVSDVQIRTAILRSQLTRSKRFAILKRDGYACHYCHRTNVPLACVLTMWSVVRDNNLQNWCWDGCCARLCGRFDGRTAWRRSRPATFGASGGTATGFWRMRGRAQHRQKMAKPAPHADGG
jgi:hypothetical protein